MAIMVDPVTVKYGIKVCVRVPTLYRILVLIGTVGFFLAQFENRNWDELIFFRKPEVKFWYKIHFYFG
jgi:hypothetical protein